MPVKNDVYNDGGGIDSLQHPHTVADVLDKAMDHPVITIVLLIFTVPFIISLIIAYNLPEQFMDIFRWVFKLANNKTDLEGEYTYQCTEANRKNKHGGVCRIGLIKDNKGLLLWTLSGERKWHNVNGTISNFEDPYHWESHKGIIFEDNDFIFSYKVKIEHEHQLGFASGKIEFKQNSKKVVRLHGTYYQHSFDGIVTGEVFFNRNV